MRSGSHSKLQAFLLEIPLAIPVSKKKARVQTLGKPPEQSIQRSAELGGADREISECQLESFAMYFTP